MTVSSTTNRKEYTGNGSTDEFSTSTVIFFDTSDLEVYVVTTATGAAELLTENTDYVVTVPVPFDGTGVVDLSGGADPYGAPSASQKLVIVRSLPLVQETDFVQNDSSDAEVAEDALDYVTMVTQQLSARIDRSFRLSDSDVSGVDLVLPEVAERASKFMSFDSNGGLVMSAGSDGTGGALAVYLATTAGAGSIGILDTGALFTATTVEAALAETATALNVAEADIATLDTDKLDVSAFVVSGLGISATVAELNRLDRSLKVSYLQDSVAEAGPLGAGLDGSDAEASIALGLDEVNGVIRSTTGDDAAGTMAVNGIQESSQNKECRADSGGLVYEIRVKLSAITNLAVFFGFTDEISSLEMPFTISGTTLTSNAADAVGFLFDTEATTDNWKLVGVANGVDAAVQDIGVAPTADTYEVLRIELSAAGAATFYRNGVAVGTTMTGAITPTVLVSPVVAGFSRAAASRFIDRDYIFVEYNRV